MKGIGLICILLTCAGAGIYAASQLRRQVRQYQLLTAFLKDCAVYIRYQSVPLQELFQILAENPDYQNFVFLQTVIRKLSPERSLESVWHEAVQMGGLPPEAERILQNIGHEIGKTDIAGQLALLELYQMQMQSACETCQTSCEQKTKLYQSIGWLSGAMLAILFL